MQSLRERKLKSRMLLQVHDELVFEVPEDEVEIMKQLVTDRMENVHPLKVPLKVEVGVGPNWRIWSEVLLASKQQKESFSEPDAGGDRGVHQFGGAFARSARYIIRGRRRCRVSCG